MYNPYQNYLVSSSTDFGLAEAWAAIGNLSASQPAMNVWAGNRYYRRHDIHINDLFMYNMSGGGGGVEDIKTPIGKLAFAWIGLGSQSGFSDLPQPTPENKAGFSKTNFDFRLYDFKLLGGTGELGVDISRADSGKDQSGATAPNTTGASVTFIHTSEKWGNENNLNKFYIQYGHGPAKTFTSGFETYTTSAGTFIRPDAPGSYRFRVADNMIFETGKHFSISPVLLYQLTDYKQYGGQQHWFSAGARPQAHFNNYVSLAFEPFVDWVNDKNTNISDYLFKMTFAPQVSLGNHFMSRPAIRGFVTYAKWGDGFRASRRPRLQTAPMDGRGACRWKAGGSVSRQSTHVSSQIKRRRGNSNATRSGLIRSGGLRLGCRRHQPQLPIDLRPILAQQVPPNLQPRSLA